MKNDTLAKTINLDDILSLNMQSDTAIPLTESVEMQSDNMQDASVDWDAIIAEWFYRLPKGYAEKPYTESELLVLEQVMHEYSHGKFNVVNNLHPTTPDHIVHDDNTDIIQEANKSLAQARKVATELDKLVTSIPAMPISEKWGVPDSDERKDFENKVKALLVKSGSDPIKRLSTFITNVNGMAQQTSSPKISDIFNRLVVLRTINGIVTGFSPSGAGFIFEALTAAIMGGQQETGKTEEGVLANADVTAAGKSYSMKLLSGKSSKLKGSKVGLAAGVKQYGLVTYVIMLRESTTGGKVQFYIGEVTPENLFAKDAAAKGMVGFIKNGTWKDYSRGKWKLTEDAQFKFKPSENVLKKYYSNVQLLGTLDVETETIRNVVQNSLVDLQQKVQPIYEALKDFTMELHTYFGTDKEKERAAAGANAKAAAKNIDAQTQKSVV